MLPVVILVAAIIMVVCVLTHDRGSPYIRSKADLSGFATLSRLLESLAPDIIRAQDRRVGPAPSLVIRGKTPIVPTWSDITGNGRQ